MSTHSIRKATKSAKAAVPVRRSVAKRKRSQRGMPRRGLVSPILVFLTFVAVGLGTWSLAQDLRSLLLWGILLVGSLALAARRVTRFKLNLAELGRGIVFGLVIGLPLAALVPDALATTADRLYGTAPPEQLLLRLVLVASIVEGIYFRGLLQPATGVGLAAVLYGVAGLILYLPAAVGFPAVLVAIVVIMAAFGLIYGLIATRYSLLASIACQAAVSLALWVLAPILAVITTAAPT